MNKWMQTGQVFSKSIFMLRMCFLTLAQMRAAATAALAGAAIGEVRPW